MKRLYISVMLCVAAMCAWAQVPMPEWTKQLVGAESATGMKRGIQEVCRHASGFRQPVLRLVCVQPQPDVRVRKVLRDGMLLIERDGQLYTLEGRKAE